MARDPALEWLKDAIDSSEAAMRWMPEELELTDPELVEDAGAAISTLRCLMQLWEEQDAD